jgi:hypothetical protein
MCFVWISEQTTIISLYSWLVFITETESVYCAVRTGSWNVIQFNFRRQTFPAPRWEANTSAACYEISCVSGSHKVHYRVHNSPQFSPTLNHTHTAHNIQSYFFKMHFNNILYLVIKNYLLSGLLTKMVYSFLSPTMPATWPAHLLILIALVKSTNHAALQLSVFLNLLILSDS